MIISSKEDVNSSVAMGADLEALMYVCGYKVSTFGGSKMDKNSLKRYLCQVKRR